MAAVPHTEGPRGRDIDEAGELQELFLWQLLDVGGVLPDERREAVEDELADVFIHCLNFAAAAGMDVPAAIHRKIDKNEPRYEKPRKAGLFSGAA
jgi:NTP pyrophosphatase (non-canonical NTP hydrolase)